MCKKYVCLISLVLLLGMVVNASAADRNWTNGNGNRLWTTAANWSGSVVPTIADKAAIRNQAISGPIIQSGMAAVANQIVVGDWSSTNDTITMTGGTLTTSGTSCWVILGYGAANKGTITMSGGTATLGDNFYVGFSGKGYLQMTGGTITVGLVFGIAQNTGSIADVNLYGGTITCSTFNMTSGGGLDITTGTLIVNGDVTTLITTYINNAWITAYGGTGVVNVSYNTPNVGKTTVTASTGGGPPGQAATPNPANGATGVNTTADLSWTAGSGATSHNVYFGTTSPGTSRGNQTATTYDTGTMANSTTYYWRIDEQNANGTTTGVVWSFTTAAAPQPPAKATTPNPASGATGVSTTNDLSWAAGSGATSHNVYFGTTSPGTLRGNQTATTYDTGTMANSTTYYWRIDEQNAAGTTTGDVWSFTTVAAGLSDTTDDLTGTISARGENLPNEGMAKAFDNLTSTKWLDFSPASSWIQYQYAAGEISVVTEYTLTSANDAQERDPTNWNLLGSNNGGSSWVTLDTRTGELFTARLQKRSFSFTNSTGYNIYRLSITALRGPAPNSVQLAEIELIGTPHEPPVPTPPGQASNPNPANGATSVSTTNDLSWTAGSGTTSHDVYFGTTSPGTFQGNQTGTTFDTGTMANSTTYYWRIDEKNAAGTTQGVVWSFTTAAAVPLPGQASTPNPANGATGISATNDLSWTAGSNATSHDVYFGTTSPGTFIGNQTATTFDTGTMANNTTYYWRIDEKNATGTTTGVIWSFTTAAVPLPGQAATPNPANAATGIGITNDLSWSAGSGATSHDVYFGTTSPGTLRGNQTATTYDTGTMAYSTTYYWRIDEKNAAGTTTGVVWSFTTAAATGVDRNWTNTNGNRLWSTAANWSGSVVPTGADKAAVRNAAVLGPIINSSTNAVANTVVVGDWSSTNDTLDMTGGTLTVNSWFVLGYGPLTNRGTFTISAGTVNVNDPTGGMYVGNTGTSIGTLNMTGGSITVATTLGIAQVAGSTGTVNLDGGTITCGALNMTTNGRLDITAGTLIVNGDVRTAINGWIASAWITGYGGSGTMNVDYNITNPGKTTVTSTPSLLPGIATNPNPAAGATGIATTNDLSWTAGYGATSHNVYFGTTSPGTLRGNQTATTYDTGTMANTTTYYWRIDEINSYGTTTGTVWSFTTQGTVVVNRVKGPYLIYANDNTKMSVLWQVDVTAGCTIAWGTDTSYSTGSAGTTEYGTASNHQHRYDIGSLTPGTHYYYRVTMGSNNYTGNFYAAPATSATNVKFFMYGDTRTSGNSNNSVCGQMISSYNADAAYQTMVLHAGDWVESDSESTWTSQWYNNSWTNIVNATSNMPFMGCIGNHEGGASVFMKYHPFPFVAARYFSFDYGPVHVAVVDQYTTYTSGSAQYNWLHTDLTNSTKLWKIIVLHQPGWCAGGTHGNDGTVQSTIQPLCVDHGVSIVLAGHNHYYSRALNNGVSHVTSGAGGAPFYSASSGQPYVVTYTVNTLECVKIAIAGNTLTGTAVSNSGTVIDTFTITK